MELDKIHVLTTYFNPIRYKSRVKAHEKFSRYWNRAGIEPWVVEVAFGTRPFMVTDKCNPRHLQLRTINEIWHKEQSLNLLVQRLPRDWKYILITDNDVQSMEKGNRWLSEVVNQLQHYEVVQAFQNALDMGPFGQTLFKHDGFVYSYLSGKPFSRIYGGWHPGYCWAYTRKAWNATGGLLSGAVLGSADDHMAKALIGRGKDSLPTGLTPEYRMMVEVWEQHAEELKKDIGFVTTTIVHRFHGPKSARKYWSRWEILKKNQYDPYRDLKMDWQGLYQLGDRSLKLRDQIRGYLRSRREDSIDIE